MPPLQTMTPPEELSPQLAFRNLFLSFAYHLGLNFDRNTFRATEHTLIVGKRATAEEQEKLDTGSVGIHIYPDTLVGGTGSDSSTFVVLIRYKKEKVILTSAMLVMDEIIRIFECAPAYRDFAGSESSTVTPAQIGDAVLFPVFASADFNLGSTPDVAFDEIEMRFNINYDRPALFGLR